MSYESARDRDEKIRKAITEEEGKAFAAYLRDWGRTLVINAVNDCGSVHGMGDVEWAVGWMKEKFMLAHAVENASWIAAIAAAFDGAMRVGHEPETIAAALAEQQRAHETSCQPDWRTEPEGEAIEHEEGGE